MQVGMLEEKQCIQYIIYSLFLLPIEGHRCSKAGCGTTLVLDGNMKNHRDVCAAKEAGYAEFDGLPGKVKTGCPNTPQLLSRYCPTHSPTVFVPHNFQAGEDVSTAPRQAVVMQEEQIAYVVNKKETRQTTFYQVQ